MAAGEGISKYERAPGFLQRAKGFISTLVEPPEPQAIVVRQAKLPRVNGYDPATKMFRDHYVDREQMIQNTGIDPFDANAISFGGTAPPYLPKDAVSFIKYANKRLAEEAHEATSITM